MRESILARLARFTVRSCLKPALQPMFPLPVQRHWANISTRTLSVPFGVRFSKSSAEGRAQFTQCNSSGRNQYCSGLSSAKDLAEIP